jgi:hypothetical protein
MRLLKTTSELHQKTEKLFSLMDELGLTIDYVAGEFRINDTTKENSETTRELRLLDAEYGKPVSSLPPYAEFRLALFD